MSTNYDTIAREYQRAKQQPWRLHIECFTLFELIGSLAGRSVLDLACGEGFYARFLKRNGAARVVGVDLSERMIDLARQEETVHPLGIEYLCQDARQLDVPEQFDLILASYLLNYASTREELLAMCQGVARCAKPGGLFVAVNDNPMQPPEHFARTEKYGFIKRCPQGLAEETPITYHFFLDGSSFEITNYHLSVATHEWAFAEAGFSSVAWHRPRLSPAGESEYGRAYWEDFLLQPPVIFLSCRKEP